MPELSPEMNGLLERMSDPAYYGAVTAYVGADAVQKALLRIGELERALDQLAVLTVSVAAQERVNARALDRAAEAVGSARAADETEE